MTKEKQIEELRDLIMMGSRLDINSATAFAETLYQRGWRKHSEDVVEVVRCKECKHYERPSLEDDDYFCIAEHTQKLFSPDKNDFCSYGERK